MFLSKASAPHEFLQFFGIPRTLHRDFCGSRFQFAETVGREFHIHGSEVFFEPMKLCRARNGNDPRLLRQKPGECDLSRCRFLLLREPADQVDQNLIRLPVLRRKARDNVAEIALVKLCIFTNLAREKTFTKRTEWNKPDAEFLKCWDHLRFRFSPPQRIFALQCRDWLD